MAVQISGNDITVPRDGTFTRNVTIGGTLTYEDVTNIDSVGLITARTGIEIGARPGVAASISVDGNMIVSGIATIGSKLGIGGITPSNALDVQAGTTNTAIVARSTDTKAQISLVDNSTTSVGSVVVGAVGDALFFTSGSGGAERARIDSDGHFGIGMSPSGVRLDVTSTVNDIARFSGANSGGITIRNDTANEIQIHTGSSDALIFGTDGENERLRIGTSGQLGIAGANYGTSGQVLQSQGSGSAIQWASVGGMTLLSSATLSSSGTTAAHITFDATGYEYLYGKLYGVTRPSSANIRDYGLRWNGTSSNVYKYVMQRMDNNGSISTYGNNSASQFYVNMQGVAAFSSGINQAVFELHLINDGVRKPFNMKHGGELSGGAIVLTTDGFYDNTAAITSLEITSTDTDINGGTLKLYGVR